MKQFIFLLLVVCLPLSTTFAGEGMWIPLLLQQLNEKEMQSMGMKMTAEDIYSVNKGSLKDAIVHFGGFCTGEIISREGLILTNHHCGFGQIQRHSSLENNYLEDGFWAMDQKEELTNPGLFVTFIVRIEDITAAILEGVTDDLSESDRQSVIDRNINAVKGSILREEYQDVLVRPFYKGNQYFLFVTETYNDIRLVGAPPSSIGKFGADTDNWIWPRHTGDFSLFRIYANKDNKPAEYAEDNVPYTPKHYLPISLDGVAENDFTLVFGFPGRTDEYIPASAMDLRVNTLNPIRIGIRDKSLEIIGKAMRSRPEARIQYASKQSGIANSWKKWIGETQGVKATGGLEKKRALEAEFTKRVNKKKAWKKDYGLLLPQLNKLYGDLKPYAISQDYINEISFRNIELLRVAGIINRYMVILDNNGEETFKSRLPRLIAYLEGFYKDYIPDVDQEIFGRLMEVYLKDVPKPHQAAYVQELFEKSGSNYQQMAEMVYNGSLLAKGEKVLAQLNEDPIAFFKTLNDDPAYKTTTEINNKSAEEVSQPYQKIDEEIELLQRKYMQALMEVFPEKRFYPDANSTLRVSYGQVKGFEPRDAIQYQPVTYLKGVIEKYVPGDYEFDVPEKLRSLYEAKDYGAYGQDGKMPVCFIGSNHTSGGNSGSPAIDGSGNLVGLNFDRVWEGTMSDINYDASICRNIMVDIRYVLFIIDKYAGATRLIKEMKLVHPKK
ncbi:MAG: Asp/Glu-specific dipeptidyl-peptidase [Saprospiraceae bacterium]|nr:MAG: Asp/Glu-specific dipeptidyl-peptidase [Saprospiraceae bacterium]